MANNFFNKLNTLVKAQINDIISPITDDEETKQSRRRVLSRRDVRGGLEKDVKDLRQRVDDALEYQDQLQQKVDNLYGEIADWDKKADDAVQAGNENEARSALARMQQSQKELEMMEADLREHKHITQELITQVTTLETVVEQAARDDSNTVNDDGSIDIAVNTSGSSSNSSDKNEIEKMTDNIVRQLDTTRQKLGDLISSYTQEFTGSREVHLTTGEDDPAAQEPRNVRHTVSQRDVDREYSARLSRLSKPPKDDK